MFKRLFLIAPPLYEPFVQVRVMWEIIPVPLSAELDRKNEEKLKIEIRFGSMENFPRRAKNNGLTMSTLILSAFTF